MSGFVFERDKFKELIIYVAHHRAGDDDFGDTHLNKTLFFSDAFALQHLGQPITGARYQKLKKGPAPRALLPVRNEMIEDGDLEVEKVGFNTTKTTALRAPSLLLFGDGEIDLVNTVIELVRGKSATRVSDESHLNSPGWNLVELGEDIPLETQFISRQPIRPETLERGRQLAARFGW